MNAPKMIILHHSATKDSGTVSWPAIRRYHIEQGWGDIGYHAGIELVGDDYEVMLGRPEELAGAHTKGKNSVSLGFCFVGDYDRQPPDPRMLEIAVDRVLLPWCRKYRLTADDIRAHYEFANKTCPGSSFPVEQVRNLIKARL